MAHSNRLPSISLFGLAFILFACGGSEEPAPIDSGQPMGPEAQLSPLDSDSQNNGENASDPLFAIEKQASLSTFHNLLKTTGLGDSMSGMEDLLILAPSDDAFDALPEGIFEVLTSPENGDELKDLLKFHLATGNIDLDALGEEPVEISSQLGPAIPVQQIGELLVVGDAVALEVIKTSNEAKPVIIVLDRVLLPAVE